MTGDIWAAVVCFGLAIFLALWVTAIPWLVDKIYPPKVFEDNPLSALTADDKEWLKRHNDLCGQHARFGFIGTNGTWERVWEKR